jgi:Co/Zn/Cd efflux system component
MPWWTGASCAPAGACGPSGSLWLFLAWPRSPRRSSLSPAAASPLLADLIHNIGDASTAIPLGIAFLLRSERAEPIAGLFVVAAIFISACVAGVEAVTRLIHPETPTHLVALVAAGGIGYAGNRIAAGLVQGARSAARR